MYMLGKISFDTILLKMQSDTAYESIRIWDLRGNYYLHCNKKRLMSEVNLFLLFNHIVKKKTLNSEETKFNVQYSGKSALKT